MVIKRGTLKERAIHTLIPYTDLIIKAAADKQPFQEVRFLTLRAAYMDAVTYVIMNDTLPKNFGTEAAKTFLDKKIKTVMDSGKVKVEEHITIADDYEVEICLDVKEINDSVIARGINLLSDIFANTEVNGELYVQLGSPKAFTYEQFHAQNSTN